MRRLLATDVAASTTQLLEKLKEERRQDDRAADGLAATAAAGAGIRIVPATALPKTWPPSCAGSRPGERYVKAARLP